MSIRFVHGNRRLLAGQTYTLECAVQKVAPLKNLTVTFYKGLEPLAERTSTRGDTKPADETFTLSFNASEEDDGAEYWCQARLDLTVQPVPPAGSSPNITASVQCEYCWSGSFPAVVLTVLMTGCVFAPSPFRQASAHIAVLSGSRRGRAGRATGAELLGRGKPQAFLHMDAPGQRTFPLQRLCLQQRICER